MVSASDSRYPEGLNNLPAEAEVDPVSTGTGVFVMDSLPHGERGSKRG